MSIRMILGRSGVGKTRVILDEIKEKCDDVPQGDPIFVITPDQMTFHFEYQLLKQSQSNSLMRVQAISINRLAYRVLQETGGLVRYHLDSVGIALLLQKVMNEKKDELSLFRHYANKPGFINKISEMISEFKSYQVSPELLQTILTQESVEQSLSQQSLKKVKDIALLYKEFESLTLSKYLMSEDYYTLLMESISQSPMISQSDIYIDGYHLFNKQEEQIILQLMRYAKTVTIVLTHDLDAVQPFFQMPQRTFDHLKKLMDENQLSYEIIQLQNEVNRFKESQALNHLEQHFQQLPLVTSSSHDISFFQAPTKRLEVEEIGSRVYHLVHELGAAYSDIAIYTNDSASYYDLFHSIFPKYNIPIFLDYTEPMIHHPLISYLYHLLDVIQNQWRYESLFTVIKTGMLMNVEDIQLAPHYLKQYQNYLRDIDMLENYSLSRNIMKKHWMSEEPFEYNRYQGLSRGYVKTDEDQLIEAKLNHLKFEITEQLVPFEQSLKNATTYQEFCEVIFLFLERCQIPKKLKLLEESATELENLKEVKQHQQVWNKILSLLEQIVEIGGQEEVSFEDFSTVLKAGLEEMTYATIPARLDQVYIGECRRARYQLTPDLHDDEQYGIKHAFVIGFNEGQIPKIPVESSLLNENEREQLKEFGIELAASLEQSLADEIFILYTVLTSPKESLTLSYVSSNDEGKEFLPSYLYTHIKDMYPNASETHMSRIQQGDIYDQLTSLQQSIPQLIQALKANPDLKEYYEPILNYYHTEVPLLAAMVEHTLHYDNHVNPLDETTTKAIYSDEITASVSRLELFNQCEFAHYVRYGLQLKEREEYKIDLPQIGELYHEALKRIALLIQKENRSFKDLTLDECRILSTQTAEELSEKLLYKILKQSPRMAMLKDKLTQVLYKTLVGLKYQGSKTLFKPLFFELPFSTTTKGGINLKPKVLPNGFQLALKGVIDRIDVAKPDGTEDAYLRIVDYKSSGKNIELDKVYYGLSLQLLTYLDVAVSNALQLIEMPAEVGGMLYFHVHRPFLSEDKHDLLKSESLPNDLKKMEMEEYKMNGYLPQDLFVAHLSDTLLEENSSSDIVPLKIKKDGQFAANGNAILPSDSMDLLRNYTNQSIIKSATKITEGEIAINPTQHQNKKACDYCQYREICQYDSDFLGNQKRVLRQLKGDEAIEAMKKSLIEEGLS